MWYIGVEEAKSAHVKHCHELTDIVLGESSEDFEVWYIGVEEAKNAHVKHCHELTDIVLGRE